MRVGKLAILAKAAATTAIAVVGSLGTLLASRWVTGIPYTSLDLIDATVIPILVGMPIALYIFIQGDKLSAAYQQLAALNAATEQAHARLRQAHEAIAFATRHDRTTGLLNREFFLSELARAHADEEDDVFLMIDADDFKQINDAFGHEAGDEALALIATTIGAAVRPEDLVGRIGGEEFGVLVKGASSAQAADIAEHIRHQVEQLEWSAPHGAPYPLSVSIGGAALRDLPNRVTEVLSHAERCLYRARNSGRNCIAFNYGLTDVASAMARSRYVASPRPLVQPLAGSQS